MLISIQNASRNIFFCSNYDFRSKSTYFEYQTTVHAIVRKPLTRVVDRYAATMLVLCKKVWPHFQGVP